MKSKNCAETRDLSVTYSKGIAIMLMVLCHAGFFKFGHDWIYTFHMPLFFFMSGYCMKEKYFSDTIGFICRRLKGVWWPFVKWMIVFILLHNFLIKFGLYATDAKYAYSGQPSTPYTLHYIILSILESLRFVHGEQLLGGYWFLRSLFWGSMISYFSLFFQRKFTKDSPVIYATVGCIILLICAAMKHYNRMVPILAIRCIDVLSGFYIYAGYAFAKLNSKHMGRIVEFIEKPLVIIAIAILIGITTYANIGSGNPGDFMDISLKAFPLVATMALLGSLMTFGVSRLLSDRVTKLSMLTFIGDNTLTVLTWHFLSFNLVDLIIIKVYGLPIVRLGEFPVISEYSSIGWWALYFAIGMALPLTLAFLNKYIHNAWLKL